MQIILWISVFAQLPVNQPHRHFALWKSDEKTNIGTKISRLLSRVVAAGCPVLRKNRFRCTGSCVAA